MNRKRGSLNEKSLLKELETMIEFFGFSEIVEETAKNLSYGHKKRLQMAIALTTKPELVMPDEPLSGMTPEEKREMVTLIKKFRDKGITIILVEHDTKSILEVYDRILVLNFGRKIAEGDPAYIKSNPQVIEAYLGIDDDRVG